GTLAPTVLPYSLPDLADATMLQMQACSLSITHPTGYPTWTMLSHLITYLPFGDCAYRANLSSAIFSALAVGTVYGAGFLLTRSAVASAVGALAFGVTSIFWSQAVIAEVYNPNAFFLGVALIALIFWRYHQRDRYLLLSAFCVGLAMTNHLTSGLLLPGALLLVLLVDRRKLLDIKLMLKSAGMFLLGLLPYLFLPLRAPSAPMKANNPDNLERFLYVLRGGDLTGGFFSFGPVELLGRMGMYVEYLLANFNFLLLVAGLGGLAALALRDAALAAFTAFLFFGWGFHAIGNDIVDVQLYFIPTYVVFALWICCGAAALLSWLTDFGRESPKGVYLTVLVAVCAGLLLLPFTGVRETYAANDYSGNREAAEMLDTVAESAEQDATILHLRSPLWYMVITEERRQDLTLVDPFQNPEPGAYNDVIWPGDYTPLETERIYGGAGDTTGVDAARKAAERGPVYLLAHEGLDTDPLREAGFRLIPQGDSFYRLVPPEEA
ncbi:MAG: DUF2723 domain-containing protein, partial [Rubrobacter sp.]|nr:DUF2723 domain-containing protein [Rubrobacter sp.]